MDLHLQSHVQTLPSYLQATTDFLKKQESLGPIPSDALLVSIDVTSLYPNIPHSDGIKACDEAWDERDISHSAQNWHSGNKVYKNWLSGKK